MDKYWSGCRFIPFTISRFHENRARSPGGRCAGKNLANPAHPEEGTGRFIQNHMHKLGYIGGIKPSLPTLIRLDIQAPSAVCIANSNMWSLARKSPRVRAS